MPMNGSNLSQFSTHPNEPRLTISVYWISYVHQTLWTARSRRLSVQTIAHLLLDAFILYLGSRRHVMANIPRPVLDQLIGRKKERRAGKVHGDALKVQVGLWLTLTTYLVMQMSLLWPSLMPCHSEKLHSGLRQTDIVWDTTRRSGGTT